MSWTPCRSQEMMWKLTVCCASANTRKEAPTLSRYCWLGVRLNWTFWHLVPESGREACLSFKQQTQRWQKIEILFVTGDHHHFPVCGWYAAALHALPASGGPSYSQTWPTRADTAQWGGLWSNCSALYIYWFPACFKVLEMTQCLHLNLLILRKCTHQWEASNLEETRSWSGWRVHSNAGRSRSRSNARLSSTAIKCLVKLKRWPVV